VEMIVKDPEVGEELTARVVRVTPSYAIVEIAPGKTGLLHVSEVSETRIRSLEDVLSVGQTIKVWGKRERWRRTSEVLGKGEERARHISRNS